MRIETFNASASAVCNTWLFETWNAADSLSHLEGLADIDVIQDKTVPAPPPPDWSGELYAHRIIRGIVRQRLHMWDERSRYFGAKRFLGGIHIPVENKRSDAIVNYDEASNILEITLLENLAEEPEMPVE